MIKEIDWLSFGRGFLFLLSGLLLLVGCSSELDKMVEECQEQFPPYAEEMAEIGEEWADTLDIAASTSRIALSGPVGELQAIRREASRLEPPVCFADEHENYLEGMDTFIGFFLDFMADADSEPDETDINIASLQMLVLQASIEQYEEDPESFFEEFKELAATATAEAETGAE
jgi:hypothetical protein